MGQRTPLGIYTNEPSENTAAFKAAKILSECGTTDPTYFLTRSGCSCTASPNEQKMIPSSFSFSLYVVLTETLSKTTSTATPASAFCSDSGIPNFSNVANSSGSTWSKL